MVEYITTMNKVVTMIDFIASNPARIGLVLLIPSIIVLVMAYKSGCRSGKFYGVTLSCIITGLLLSIS